MSALEDLRRAQDRDLATEGIPMYLALVDATAGSAAVEPTTRPDADGAAVAADLDRLHDELAPGQRDHDLGGTAALLATAAYVAFGRPPSPVPYPVPPAPGLQTSGTQTPVPQTPGTRTPGTPLGWRAHRDHIAAGRLVRVVNYHNTPRSSRAALRAELAAYQRDFVGLGLADLDAFFTLGQWPAGDRPGFLPVFYEGYANHAAVAAPVCEELGLTGWFAVCTGFLDCPVAEQEFFARAHWIALAAEELTGDRLAMTWDEVTSLSRRHVVFAHTSSHEGIAETVTDADLDEQVRRPKQQLDARTGQDSAAFAWLGGTPYGAGERHDRAIVEAGYRYVVSNTMIQRIGAGHAGGRRISPGGAGTGTGSALVRPEGLEPPTS